MLRNSREPYRTSRLTYLREFPEFPAVVAFAIAALFFLLVAFLVHFGVFSSKTSVNHPSASKGEPSILTRPIPVWGPLISQNTGPLRSHSTIAPIRDDSTKTPATVGTLRSHSTIAPIRDDSTKTPATVGTLRSTPTKAPVRNDATNSPVTFGSSQWTAPPGTMQIVLATSSSDQATTGEVSAYSRLSAGDGWKRDFGPYPAYMGYGGLAPVGQKREADGRTPLGAYTLTNAFGVAAEPKTLLPWRSITRGDSWDDDPSSPGYNLLIPAGRNAGASPEPLYEPEAYRQAIVVDYNINRTPGAGSAIFLHVATGGPTAGCISIPESGLMTILGWLNPVENPMIVITIGYQDN
jgi:L,D-peptidoglycan transpeptidase YkuD (ErfK/YbiS/YcfS/YnhG family)